MSSSNELMLEVASEQIEEALASCTLEELKGLSELKQAIRLATGMKALRAALTPKVVEELFVPLCGSPLGFRTDRDTKPLTEQYSIAVITDCVIEAMIRGFSVVGNEFNIIAGRAYFTKEGLERRVSEWPEMRFFESAASMPKLNEKGDTAAVAYRGSWEVKGVKMELNADTYPVKVTDSDGRVLLDAEGKEVTRMVDERIPIRVNAGMGLDAVLGKARRKYLALVLRKLTGQRFGIVDGDTSDLGSITTTGETVSPASTATANAAARADELVQKRREERAAEKTKTGSKPPPGGGDPEPGVNPAG